MMHEEFTRLSKVETTCKFYRESIEPLYTEMNVDKETFVEQWLKDNKANIVKSHSFDIDRASRELALKECNSADLERFKAENNQLQQQSNAFEAKYEMSNSRWQASQRVVDGLKADYHEICKQAEQIEPLNVRINELENDIIRLKARLFDMLEDAKAI